MLRLIEPWVFFCSKLASKLSCNQNILPQSIVPLKRVSTITAWWFVIQNVYFKSIQCIIHNSGKSATKQWIHELVLVETKFLSFLPKLWAAVGRSVDSVAAFIKVLKIFSFFISWEVEREEVENWLWKSRLGPVMGAEHEKLSLCVKAARYMAAHIRLLQQTWHG